MSNGTNIQKKPLPERMPATVEDFAALRVVKSARTLNDMVEQGHLLLYGRDPAYVDFLYAVYDEQAVEGSLSADNIKAAEKIRNFAADHDDLVGLRREKLATISKALGVVLRRYKQDRRTRRDTVDGKVVASDSNE